MKLERLTEINSLYKDIFGILAKNVDTLLYGGNAEHRLDALEKRLDTLDEKDVVVFVASPAEAVLDHLHSRLALLEAHVLPGAMMNKQALMRMLGLSEEQITRKLLEEKKDGEQKTPEQG
jgi:hypothetical protein